jgi:uncharacterized protein (DUF302 family)
MKALMLAITTAALVSSTAHAGDLVTRTSPYSVSETVDRLQAAVEGAGAKVFVRVDHAAGANSVDAELRPTVMLMFGNPKLGTPAMQLSQSSGLDLPLRVVVYETEAGDVVLAYHPPSDLASDHGIPADAEVLAKMTGALEALTGKAIAP